MGTVAWISSFGGFSLMAERAVSLALDNARLAFTGRTILKGLCRETSAVITLQNLSFLSL